MSRIYSGFTLLSVEYLQGGAPLINGAFFGRCHFWQTHNLIAVVVVGIILSHIVWKTRNVYLGIVLHCTINIPGAVGGYFAVPDGIDSAR